MLKSKLEYRDRNAGFREDFRGYSLSINLGSRVHTVALGLGAGRGTVVGIPIGVS